eukprot:6206819-Pleurochrysis_carterae.AAC.2
MPVATHNTGSPICRCAEFVPPERAATSQDYRRPRVSCQVSRHIEPLSSKVGMLIKPGLFDHPDTHAQRVRPSLREWVGAGADYMQRTRRRAPTP